MNQTLHFRFAATPKDGVTENISRRLTGRIAVVCLLFWFVCVLLRSSSWIEAAPRQFGLMFTAFYWMRWAAALLKERARWGGINLDNGELAVNTINSSKQKIPLHCVQSWKIQGKHLVIRWTKPSNSWFKNRVIAVPFQDLEKPEEFLADFEKYLAIAKETTSNDDSTHQIRQSPRHL